MRIYIIGCWSEHGTNTSIYYALKNLGHDVKFYSYIKFGTWELCKNLFSTEDEIFLECRELNPDLIFICKGEHLSPLFLRNLSKKCKTLYWFMDPELEFNRVGAEFLARECTNRAFTSSFLAEKYNGIHIFEGYDPLVWGRGAVEKDINILFAGNIDQHRKDLLNHLDKNGIQVTHVEGRSYQKLNEYYNRSKIVLNFVRDPSIISDRVVQTLATNTVLVTEFSEELFKLYNWKHWVDFVFIGKTGLVATVNKVLQHYEYYLNIQSKFPYKNYTWESQMQEVIKHVV